MSLETMCPVLSFGPINDCHYAILGDSFVCIESTATNIDQQNQTRVWVEPTRLSTLKGQTRVDDIPTLVLDGVTPFCSNEDNPESVLLTALETALGSGVSESLTMPTRRFEVAEQCLELMTRSSSNTVDKPIKLDFVGEDFAEIHLTVTVSLMSHFHNEENSRELALNLKFKIPANFPDAAPLCSCVEVPEPFGAQWIPKTTRLLHVCEQFLEAASFYVDFWSEMADIDAKMLVLEPRKPTLADTWRRIAIDSKCNLTIRLDPKSPRALPQYTVFGPVDAVSAYTETANQNICNTWDESLSLAENLERLFNTSFMAPPPDSVSANQISPNQNNTEALPCCAVCSLYNSIISGGGAAPELTCEHCNALFHHDCLLQRFRQQTRNGRVNLLNLGYLLGKCPLCSKQIRLHLRKSSAKRNL